MEHNVKLSLQEEVKKDARKIEKEIAGNPALKNVKVSEKMENQLFLRIKEYKKKYVKKPNTEKSAFEILLEPASDIACGTNHNAEGLLSEKERGALSLDRKLLNKKNDEIKLEEVNKKYHKHLNDSNGGTKSRTFHMPRKKRLLVALAAVLVLVAGLSMTSVGSKSYLKTLLDKWAGKQDTQTIDVKDMEKQNTEDEKEVSAYAEIRKKLGVVTVRFGYMPKGMKFQNINIDEEQKSARLFYRYNGQIIRYTIYLNDADSSFGQKKEDKLEGKFTVETDIETLTVEEYEMKESEESRFVTNFSYKGVNYQLKGVMDRKDFVKILKNIIYFNKSA
ncbi:DUF4367 domain-containing protein [Muricomes intestini]|uniref:Uncharacterized protein DUF4367 n=1 Tax=Muricomes intestini TaxID=1796634 RepID=A0A4R3K9C8_9FIRM|nr:DUF4367 domain-containing protein [Muricomes intestini]TCS79453.1 uncharacterized protein DUF4367 [Muricomes intestini]